MIQLDIELVGLTAAGSSDLMDTRGLGGLWGRSFIGLGRPVESRVLVGVEWVYSGV